MKKTIIGLVGPIASGKGVVAKYLKSLGFDLYSLSDRVREEAALRGLSLIRENLQNVGNDLRAIYGGQVLAERTLELMTGLEECIVIDAIRNPAEIEFLKKELGVTIIGIDADTEKRMEWYLWRAGERGEDGATEEDFFRANNRDLGIGEEDSGQQVGRCLDMADIIIRNEGSKRYLLEEVDYHLILDLGFGPEGARRRLEKK